MMQRRMMEIKGKGKKGGKEEKEGFFGKNLVV